MPIISADPDQTPVDISGDDALRERRNQSCLRRGQRVRTRFSARRADETVSVIHEIEHRRDDERARDHADDQRDLLLPWRRIDQLSGLEVLQVIIGDRRHIEDHRGREKRECHQRFAGVRADVRFDADHQQQRRADHD